MWAKNGGVDAKYPTTWGYFCRCARGGVDMMGYELSKFTTCGGCAAKLSPGALRDVVAQIPPPSDARLLVGFETSDDAAVYQLRDDLAVIHTTDFFPPMVDVP